MTIWAKTKKFFEDCLYVMVGAIAILFTWLCAAALIIIVNPLFYVGLALIGVVFLLK